MDDFKELWKQQRERKAFLALADGTVFHGRAFGDLHDRTGEAVFNTGMTGYQEIISDPSYAGQFVTLTTAEVGNHDYLTPGSLYLATARPENLFIFPDSLTSVYLEDINTRVWGFSWARPVYDSMPFELPELNKNEINLMCLHGDALSARGLYMPLDAKAFARAGFDYAALGHIHKPQRINDSAFYAGSMAPLDFSEAGRHGFFSGEADTGKLSVSFTPVAIREFEDIAVDVTGMESHAAIVEAAREKIKDPSRDFVRMTFTGARGEDIDISEVEMSLGEDMYCPVFADDTVADYDLDSLFRENEGNVIGLFIQEYRQKAETDKTARAALYAGLDALLSSGRNDS